jgi:hypothetical protein
VTLRTACNIRDVTSGTLTATDTCVGYHVTRFEASRNVILHTRYVSTYVGAGCGRGRGTKKPKRKFLMQQQASTSSETELVQKEMKAEYDKQYRLKRKLQMLPLLTCDKYKSSLRHT